MRATITTLALALLLCAGCGEGSEGLKQIGDGLEKTWEGVKTFTVEQRDQAEAFFDENLEGLDEKLAAAKEKAAKLGSEASGALDAQWADVSSKLEDMKNASGDQWEKARDAFVAAYEAFQAELDK